MWKANMSIIWRAVEYVHSCGAEGSWKNELVWFGLTWTVKNWRERRKGRCGALSAGLFDPERYHPLNKSRVSPTETVLWLRGFAVNTATATRQALASATPSSLHSEINDEQVRGGTLHRHHQEHGIRTRVDKLDRFHRDGSIFNGFYLGYAGKLLKLELTFDTEN